MRRIGTHSLVAVAVMLAGCQASTDSSSSSSGGARSSAPKARPAAASLVVPAGVTLPLELQTGISSESSKEGELIVARLTEDVRVGERVALREGTEVRGHVVSAIPSGRVKGRAHLAFDFDRIVVGGKEHEIALREIDLTAGSGKKKDAAIIGGSAGAGAIIGAIADGGKGAAVGGLVGGAAGTGVVLATKGEEVKLPAGTRYTLKLDRELRL